MKKINLSVKWKVFSYMLLFIGILLTLLWLFQTVFLDEFYKEIKSNNIKSIAEKIEKSINDKNISETLEEISIKDDIRISILSSEGEVIYSAPYIKNSLIDKIDKASFERIYKQTYENNGVIFKVFKSRDFKLDPFNSSYNFNEKYIPKDKGSPENMVYTKIINGSKQIMIIESVITPVNATVETIRVQLLYISIILIALSLIIAFLISRKISSPISKINESAKRLANKDYSIEFSGSGYLEIEELNDTLNIAAKELSKVEGLRREFISNVSHDLRTPLTMIAGYAEVMRDIPGENTPENVQVIIEESKRLSNLVNDILDISQIESGNKSLNLKKINITESIESIKNRFSVLLKNEDYNISFNYKNSIYVLADDLKISQVIYNLINNAIEHTKEGKIIEILQEENNGFVTISVIDKGEGIKEEDIPYIWDRYYKKSKNYKRERFGTGLGLSIVKGILEMHEAEYGVESKEGEGSRFWFKLKIYNNLP